MNKKQGGGFALVILLLIILIAAIVGFGVYLYTQGQLGIFPTDTTVDYTQPQVTPPQTSELEKEANSITIEDGESEFTPVDKDINSL